ncbi:MAG: hypothetical protein JW937_09395, partial [Candidatus Omnitrophica bacterium]|nr:hypothetical protein [Candidatus Omnitrophota bacterium]
MRTFPFVTLFLSVVFLIIPIQAHAAVSWDFDTDGDMQGWRVMRGLTNESVSGGALTAEVSDTNPHLRS